MILIVIIALSPIYGVYLNRFQASKETYLEQIFSYAQEGLINSIILDVKDDRGIIPYKSRIKLAQQIKAIKPSINLKRLRKEAAKNRVKLIGRIAVFRDDQLSKTAKYAIGDPDSSRWVDSKGIGWVDPHNKEVWEYNIAIAQEILDNGFDFVFFDYIRFPSDGNLNRCIYKEEKDRFTTIQSFIDRAREKIDKFGICVFGYSVWRPLQREGQRLNLYKKVAALGPMLYPSHFSRNFKKEKGTRRPYYIYYESVKRLKDSLSDVKIYPFVQCFDYLSPNFDENYIKQQIQGIIDGGGDGFFIWNAGDDYHHAWSALEQIGGRRIAFLIRQGSRREAQQHQKKQKDYRRLRTRIPYQKKSRIHPLHDIQSDILP